jgi:glucose uptake protein
LGILYSIITVFAWGTWLAPSQNIVFKNQQIKTFYVAAANLVLATIVFLLQPATPLASNSFWLPFIGGIIWSVSGFLAFTATDRLGMARAYGIWTPINVAVSILWGIFIFGEFLSSSPSALILSIFSAAILTTGVLLIIFAKGAGQMQAARSSFWIGVFNAVGAGILWGTYFIPLKIVPGSMWILSFPLSLGIFVGSAALVALSRQPISLQNPGQYFRVTCTGLLWGIGNFGMLLLVQQLGAGRGFTISQLGVVVNALTGIYILRDPQPRSRAAVFTLLGCALACGGGILLGSLK